MTDAKHARRQLRMDVEQHPSAEIARWLWILGDTRARTHETLDGIDVGILGIPGPGGNSVATILDHIAAIEVDWLYVEILEQPYPDDLNALLPPDVRDDAGNLMAVPGKPLSAHMHALGATRERLMDIVRALDPDDLRRPRPLPQYDVTPEWVLHHLVQHEAEHRAEIALTRAVLGNRTMS